MTVATMEWVFGPDDPLEAAIRKGDHPATLAALRSLTPVERQGRRAGMLAMGTLMQQSHWASQPVIDAWGGRATAAQYRARDAAMMVCGRPEDLVGGPSERSRVSAADWHELCRDFAIDPTSWRADLRQAVDAELARRPERIVAVQRWIAAGLLDRPRTDAYTVGLIALPLALQWQGEGDMAAQFAGDPGLREAALRLFEVEGDAEHNLASFGKSKSPTPQWDRIFLQGLADGAYSRPQLLDKTLGALEADWAPFRAGWLSGFHCLLAPTAAEMSPRADRYLALCRSRVPATVTLALDALKVLLGRGAVDGAALLAVLPEVMVSRLKGQVEAALKLADGVVARQPSLGQQAAAACAAGLVHDSAELQKRVLRRLATWGMCDDTRQRVAESLSNVAAVNRPALSALLGDDDRGRLAPAQRPEPGEAVTSAITDPLDPGRALSILGLDALPERCAFVLENEAELDEFERVVEALVRLAPLATQARVLFAPVVKRARKFKREMGVAAELARLLIAVATGERVASWCLTARSGWPPDAQSVVDVDACLAWRIDDCIDQAALGLGLAPLESATHRRGFVSPRALVDRVAACQAKGFEPAPLSQVQALLRLPPPGRGAGPDSPLLAARALRDTPFVRATRHAFGDTVAVFEADPADGPGFALARDLFLAAARVRHPGGDDPVALAAWGDMGPDAALAARCRWEVRARREEGGSNGMPPPIHHDLVLITPPRPAGALARTALARHRLPGPADAHWTWWRFAGRTEASVACAASMLPADLEPHFAGGAEGIGGNLRWPEVHREHHAYPRLLLDPTVPVGPMACLALALALGAKDAGLVALAVDAWVRCHADGRLDPAALGDVLRRLIATPLLLPARYGVSLTAAVRADPRMPPAVHGLLCDMLAVEPGVAPKDLVPLMSLLLELSLTLRRPLPAGTRSVLTGLTLSGKARAVQKDLLEAPGAA